MTNRPTDKRSAILQAALEVFAENGFHGSPTSLIAQKAGVGAGTIYRYFESKDDLIIVLQQEIDAKLRPAIQEGLDLSNPVKNNFLRIHNNLLRYLLANRNESRFLEQFYNSPYGLQKKREGSSCGNFFIELFQRGVREQMIKDLPSDALFALSIGPLVILTRDHHNGLMDVTENIIEAVLEGCWDAVKL